MSVSRVNVYVLVVLSALLCSVLGKSGKANELQVIREHIPDNCYEVANAGDEVAVHYTGKLESGQVFDSSRQGGRDPLAFVLGEGRVIPGWEQGIHGMCVGERRKLIIPPHLAYGEKGYPPSIPPSATLHFETELVEIKSKPTEEMLFSTLRMLAIPALVIYVLYYLYGRYNAETVKEPKEKRERKEGNVTKKKSTKVAKKKKS